MVFYADIKQGESILEPSAGQGAIIDEIIKLMHDDNNLFYVEQMNTNLSIIYKKYGHIKNVFDMHPLNDDFLLLSAKCFDKIIANPPFNKNQDIDHIYKMYECLNPGGRIVTIASKHWLLSSNKKEKAFKEWLYNTVESDVNTIDAGTFSESGTKIETCLIIIDKPLN
jgi:phospholipid N-methyltransferase